MEPRITRLPYSLFNFFFSCPKVDHPKTPPNPIYLTHQIELLFFFSRWLITPYRDNGHLTAQQRRFNTVLSSLRQKVECAIGLLKGRWRRLLFLDFLDLKLAVHFIIATCVLHNSCILCDDFYDGYLMDDDSDDHHDDGHHCPGGTAEQKRTHLMNIVCA